LINEHNIEKYVDVLKRRFMTTPSQSDEIPFAITILNQLKIRQLNTDEFPSAITVLK